MRSVSMIDGHIDREDSRMTDKEIIKALELKKYSGHSCVNCKYGSTKGEYRCGLKGCNIARNALDIINRQQAEIERLTHEREILIEDIHHSADQINEQIEEIERLERHTEMYYEVRAEAIKEFAERLKDSIKKWWVMKGEYLIIQSGYNNHIHIYKNGKMICHANCNVKKSEKELIDFLEEFKRSDNNGE